MSTVVFKREIAKRVVKSNGHMGLFNEKEYQGSVYQFKFSFLYMKNKINGRLCINAEIPVENVVAVSSESGHMKVIRRKTKDKVYISYLVIDTNAQGKDQTGFTENCSDLSNYRVIELAINDVTEVQYILYNEKQYMGSYLNSKMGESVFCLTHRRGPSVSIPMKNIVDEKAMSDVHCGESNKIRDFEPMMVEI